METKSVVISSSGLKNIIVSKFNEEDQFHLLFDQIDIKMNNIFAEFICPIISKIRQSDPTINSIQFKEFYAEKSEIFVQFIKDVITEDIIYLLQQISSGYSIELNSEQAYKMRFVSIILGNEELFTKINENYPPDFNAENIDLYIQYIKTCYQFSQMIPNFDFSILLNGIAENFASIDLDKLISVPKPILYSIISNPNIKMESEDSLFDFIQKITQDVKTDDDSNFDDILFYEEIEFSLLSFSKLHEFFDNFDLNRITNGLWSKILPCIFQKKNERFSETNYINKTTINYDGTKNSRFKGIVHFLNEKCNGNSAKKGLISVTSSSVNWINPQKPYEIADLDNKSTHFSSNCGENQWVMYDFKERRVRPNFYSIRTWNAGPGNSHLRSWVIEGSNSNRDDDWKVLDEKKNVDELNNTSAEVSYKISTELNQNEAFQYLRIRQTGLNSFNTNLLFLSALEFFGKIM